MGHAVGAGEGPQGLGSEKGESPKDSGATTLTLGGGMARRAPLWGHPRGQHVGVGWHARGPAGLLKNEAA